MNKILALWAVPRSTSTAFEWMMRTRGDMTCFHEPIGEAWYQGEEPLWPRATEDSLRIPGLTREGVWQTLREAAAAGPVFTKEFPLYVIDMADDEFLDLHTHSFLIRNPAKTITSIYKQWPDFHPLELGFAELRELFDRICDRDGQPPPLIDSDDLMTDPHRMVELYCNAVGIPFLPEALSWEPGNREEVSWWDGGTFHANLRNSTGLTPQVSNHVDISETPEKVQQHYRDVIPHYEHLYQYRLTLDV